jgi:hypothetical protein
MNARARQLLQRRLERLEDAAGVHDCPTCSHWWDVIEIVDVDGAKVDRRPFWRRWPRVDGCCPDCRREPRVYVVSLYGFGLVHPAR